MFQVRIEGMGIDKEALVDFFRAVDPICFTGDLVLSNVDFSVASFRNLFGECVQPDMVQFNGARGISGETLSKSLNSLAGLRYASTVMVLPAKSEDAFKLSADDVVDFLHNYAASKYRRFVTDFECLTGGFNELVHKLFDVSISFL